MGGCMGQKVGSGQMTNFIKLELINIIWFSLKIYNLLRHPYLWVDGCVNGWAHVKPLKSNKSWPNQDNSIMDILDILLDILLKPPQPLMGLFFILDLLFLLLLSPLFPTSTYSRTANRRPKKANLLWKTANPLEKLQICTMTLYPNRDWHRRRNTHS